MIRASVTECHLCHRCPRLLAYHAGGRRKAWLVGLRGEGHFPGTVFHDSVARPFYEALASSGRRAPVKRDLVRLLESRPRDLSRAFHGLLQEHVLDPLLSQQAHRFQAEAILALGRGIELWADHLARFFEGRTEEHFGRWEETIGQIFMNPETLMSKETRLADGGRFQLSGRFDSLLVDPADHEAVLIEFKGYRPEFPDEELIQVGLYGWLIHQTTGLRPRGIVLYLDEEEAEAVWSAGELAGVGDNLPGLFETTARVKESLKQKGRVQLPPPTHPHLCEECFLANQCDKDWGDRSKGETETALPPSWKSPREKQFPAPPPDPGGDGGHVEAMTLLNEVVSALGKFRCPVDPDGYVLGPRLVRLKVRPRIEDGTTVRKIMNRADDLKVALEIRNAPLIQAQPGYVSLDVPRRVVTPLTLGELLAKGEANRPDSEVAFPLGMAVDGSVAWADLAEPSMTSILVAGTAGSGKSIFLRAVIVAMAMNAGPDEVCFTLIDPKRVSFHDLRNLPHLHRPDRADPGESPVVMDIEGAFEVLGLLVEEMEQRYDRFSQQGVIDIEDYNARRDPLPHHVVVIDEYADLMTDRTYKADTELLIQRLCQKGRAAGFHIILSTQRPDSKVVTPIIKANLQLKVALKVTTGANSSVIIDEPGAERLMGKGDMLVGGAVPVERLQGALPTRTEIEKARNRAG